MRHMLSPSWEPREGVDRLPSSPPPLVQPQLSPGLPNAGLRVRGALQMRWAEVWALWAGAGGRYACAARFWTLLATPLQGSGHSGAGASYPERDTLSGP